MFATGELTEKERDGDVPCIEYRKSTFYAVTCESNLREFETIKGPILEVTGDLTLLGSL